MGMPLIIVGGNLGGVVTPTEAGALAVIYSLLLGFLVRRVLKIADLIPLLKHTATLTAAVMMIMAPIAAPFGIDPVHFGVIMVLNHVIGAEIFILFIVTYILWIVLALPKYYGFVN